MSVPTNGTITRVVPVNGLLVDADLWAAAHDYHRLHQQRHTLLLHGHGIAAGLEVVAHEPANRTLLIYPGLAIDPSGIPILVSECERYIVQNEDPGPIHILLEFREVAAGSRGPAVAGKPTHLVEAFRIYEARALPPEPHIEVARVLLTGGRTPIVDAEDSFGPGPNQIDGRYRLEAGGLARGGLAIGQAWPKSVKSPLHAGLPVHLTRALATLGYQASYVGQVAPDEAAGRCALLYLAGQGGLALDGSDVEGLRAFIAAGGTILADSSPTDPGKAFAGLVQDLATRLDCPLEEAEPGSLLLSAPYLFATPPPGCTAGELLVGDGLIFTSGAYGGALDGGPPGRPLDRAQMRAVLEMVCNIALAAHRRQRQVAFAAHRRAP